MNEEEIIIQQPANCELLLATMSSGTKDVGLKLIIDGQDSATTKSFKLLLTGREPPRGGDRVLVLKISGTYIVLGKVGYPSSWWHTSNLSTSATQSDIISKVNAILNCMFDTGILKKDE